jgi:uncharacterized membrane protein
MDKQDHNRIDSIKARPTTANSLNSGDAQPSDDALAEIRDDYRRAKEQLKRYNKFIDKHELATVLIPLLLSLVGFIALLATSGRSRLSPIIVIIIFVAIGLFPTAFILALICRSRTSSKAKIEHRLKDLGEEAAQYRRATALGEKNISRDELGLFQESLAKQQNETTEQSEGLILLGGIAIILQFFRSLGAISILASIAALIISIILVASKNPVNKRYGKYILVIWIVVNSISFIHAYNNAHQAQQTQEQPSYYNNYQ